MLISPLLRNLLGTSLQTVCAIGRVGNISNEKKRSEETQTPRWL